MPPTPVLAFDLSKVLIEDVQMRNLGATAATANVSYDTAHEAFDPLFRRLTGQVLPALPEAEFWSKLAEALHFRQPAKLRWAFFSEFGYVDGMQALLMGLRSLRVPAYVWTNMPTAWVEALNERLSLMDLVTACYNGHADGCYKPQAEFFRRALAAYNLNREDVIYVGGHRSNLEGARPFTADQWTFQTPPSILSRVQNLLRADREPTPSARSLVS